MNRSSFAHAKFKENGVLCVNVLSGQHQNLSAIFANSQLRSEERFLHEQWLTLETGSPVLATAVASIDCTYPPAMKWAVTACFIARSDRFVITRPATGWCGSIASSIPLARSRTAKVHPDEKYPIA